MYKNVEHANEEKSYIDSVIIMYKNVEFVYEEKCCFWVVLCSLFPLIVGCSCENVM